MRFLCLQYVHSMNHLYAYLRVDRKINFTMVSVQHFINEAHGLSTLHSKMLLFILFLTILLKVQLILGYKLLLPLSCSDPGNKWA